MTRLWPKWPPPTLPALPYTHARWSQVEKSDHLFLAGIFSFFGFSLQIETIEIAKSSTSSTQHPSILPSSLHISTVLGQEYCRKCVVISQLCWLSLPFSLRTTQFAVAYLKKTSLFSHFWLLSPSIDTLKLYPKRSGRFSFVARMLPLPMGRKIQQNCNIQRYFTVGQLICSNALLSFTTPDEDCVVSRGLKRFRLSKFT